MRIRELTAGDLYVVGGMLRKVLPDIAKITKSSSGDNSAIGMALFELLLDRCYDDAWGWLASLVDMDVETFNKQPLNTPQLIFKQLQEQEGLADFLAYLRSQAAAQLSTP